VIAGAGLALLEDHRFADRLDRPGLYAQSVFSSKIE
jgi:hypothetical protein